ncbi:unnamed protein product, partial [Ectocarpus sp. 4 AP-2014]
EKQSIASPIHADRIYGSEGGLRGPVVHPFLKLIRELGAGEFCPFSEIKLHCSLLARRTKDTIAIVAKFFANSKASSVRSSTIFRCAANCIVHNIFKQFA